jgi:tetratricopeptide (TPR) repeat protein
VGARGLWLKYTTPEPPVIDLTGVDKEIVEKIEGARQGVLKSPRSADHWGELGAVLRAHEFLEESNVCFAQAERLAPQDYRWPYLIGVELLGHDQEAALPRLRRAVELCGEQAAPRLRLGEVLLERGELAEAETLFRGVLEQNAIDGQDASERTLNEARAHLGLGQVALDRGDVADAREHLRRAAAAAPQAKVVHAALLQANRRAGDEEGVAEELRIVGGLPEAWSWPDPTVQGINRVWVGLRARMATINALDQQGFREEAVVAARQTMLRYPESALARLVLGEMLNRAGNVRAAEPVLRESIRMDPERSKAYFELGYALQHQGKTAEAVECYRRSIEKQSDFPVSHYNLALCLVGLKNEAAAVEEFRTAIRCRPGYLDALLGLGMLLTKQGRHREALESVEEALRVAPPTDHRPKELRDVVRREIALRAARAIGDAHCWPY